MKLRFGSFTLDRRARQLTHAGQAVHLSPKAFDLLVLLLQRRPEAISKAEVHEQLWPRTFVSDINLAVLIAEIRTALGEDARRPQFIRTVHRYGYAFEADVVQARTSLVAVPTGQVCWLVWGSERKVLHLGQNVAGRDIGADICVDAIGVSRRHAIIELTDADATLHDLNSKNGTYVNDARIQEPVMLADGCEIRLGPVALSFRRMLATSTTQTVNLER